MLAYAAFIYLVLCHLLLHLTLECHLPLQLSKYNPLLGVFHTNESDDYLGWFITQHVIQFLLGSDKQESIPI